MLLINPAAATDSEHVQSEPRPSTIRHVLMSPMTSRVRRQTRGFERHKEDSTCKKRSLL